ncbi:MAG: peptidylprolyl isomerase [Anaerolineaceae bacterium]|jgi:FKBP-type peptidyl-prolyl cis-trans isomerase SlyD|nr:peptidylprolyl isomerase [Anaerolineaceae bacterium]
MSETKPTQIENDVIVSLLFTLTVDGEIVDEADENEPFLYLHGHENVIPGMEKELAGMKIGESKSFTVQPKDGYGESDPDEIMHLPRSEFPEDLPLEPGLELEMLDEDDEVLYATVVSITKTMVQLDFNHPLADKELNFEVTVLDLEAADPEELDHGHVHHH